MTGRVAGKRILVTAAGQGIGRATAALLAREGAEVWATDLDAAKLDGLDACTRRALDVCSEAAIDRVLAEAGPFDGLVSCAGMVPSGTILDCTPDDWARTMMLNVTATYQLVRAMLPSMIVYGGGSIVTLASVASSIKGVPNRFAYGASKAALIGLTKAIAADHVSEGIRANAICPGTVETPSLTERLEATGDFAAAHAAFTARQPMGRLGRADEIAALALYLVSDEAAFTTGQVHIIDGGWSN